MCSFHFFVRTRSNGTETSTHLLFHYDCSPVGPAVLSFMGFLCEEIVEHLTNCFTQVIIFLSPTQNILINSRQLLRDILLSAFKDSINNNFKRAFGLITQSAWDILLFFSCVRYNINLFNLGRVVHQGVKNIFSFWQNNICHFSRAEFSLNYSKKRG